MIGIEVYYNTLYGIKVLNRKPDNPTSVIETIPSVDPSCVLLFSDGLKDLFSLTGKKIAESPHYYLVKGILEEKPSLCQEYIDREVKGALDGRFPLKVTSKTIVAHKKNTVGNYQFIVTGNYEHPKVISYNGNYYALDGKHRLAMAAYLGKDISCDIVSLKDILLTQYIQKIYHKMSESPKNYSKNLELLSSMMASLS